LLHCLPSVAHQLHYLKKFSYYLWSSWLKNLVYTVLFRRMWLNRAFFTRDKLCEADCIVGCYVTTLSYATRRVVRW
jgi:hypothetical protein